MVSGLPWDEIQDNAAAFSKRWRDSDGREKQRSRRFIEELLEVFGMDCSEGSAASNGFEYPVRIGTVKWIDFLLPGVLAVESKSRGEKHLEGDGLVKTIDQLRKYMENLPNSGDVPDVWLLHDFENMCVLRRDNKEKKIFKTAELRKNVRQFAHIAGYTVERTESNSVEVNIKAAGKMAKLHDALKELGYDGHELRVYLVRLLFCMFADDTGIFPDDNFMRYVQASEVDGTGLGEKLDALFLMLNRSEDARRNRRFPDGLIDFRHVNGGLFEERLDNAFFDKKAREVLLDCIEFDWSEVRPEIFGAMFQGVMGKEERRNLGAHYTSETNILKVIKPLFLDALWEEFERVKVDRNALVRFHDKLADLKFLDPACGCGNFLIVTYRELRKLEFEVLKMKFGRQNVLDMRQMLKVSVEQFYGIECEDFPCQIAQVGMWLTEHQVNVEVSAYFGGYYANLPLKETAHIKQGNALVLDWVKDLVDGEEQHFDYIFGNPPFIGYSNQSELQKDDIKSVYIDENNKPFKTAGKIDYVAGWFYKAAKLMALEVPAVVKDSAYAPPISAKTKAAFVATSSVTQGEQVASVWKPLFDMFDIHIDFAYRSFKWRNEASGKAAVDCVIVGFSKQSGKKILYDEKGVATAVDKISPYLISINGEIVYVESRNTPLWDAPDMVNGNRPADGAGRGAEKNKALIIDDSDLPEFIKADPKADPDENGSYIKRFVGADEFIYNTKRWCLWLVGTTAGERANLPKIVQERIAECKKNRENAVDAGRRKLAATPWLFRETNTPDRFIVIPRVSSEKREYIPMDFMGKSVGKDVIAAEAVHTIPGATVYHFGVLQSKVHMAWVGAVCGRLESRFRYSKDVVYNNFPWIEPTEKQREDIERCAQAVLDARAAEPDSSLDALYKDGNMPKELRSAHDKLDKAVLSLYELDKDSEIVAHLMELYRAKVDEEKATKNK